MKSNSNESADTLMGAEGLHCKLRFLALVVNTGNLINERATTTNGINHATVAPIAIFTTYFFFSIFIISDCCHRYSSKFIQIYALISCVTLHITLSIVVFMELRRLQIEGTTVNSITNSGQALNGVLPMFTTLLLLADLTVMIFANRQETTAVPITISEEEALSAQEPIQQQHT